MALINCSHTYALYDVNPVHCNECASNINLDDIKSLSNNDWQSIPLTTRGKIYVVQVLILGQQKVFPDLLTGSRSYNVEVNYHRRT